MPPSDNRASAARPRRVCPKTGRLIPERSIQQAGQIMLLLSGLLSLLWFLLRVIPKPSRAAYPCQRAALPVASTFIVWLLGAAGSTWAWRRSKAFFRRSLFLKAGVCAAAAVLAGALVIFHSPQPSARASITTLNMPVGVGKGIHPGRVVWVHAPDATQWDGFQSPEHWWQTNHTDLTVVENMFGQSLRSLTGEKSDATAWDALFKHFNQQRGKGSLGYQAGEKIAVKINLTTCNARSGNGTVDKTTDYEKKAGIMNTIDNSPQMILCLLRQLVYTVGVRQADISVGDPTGLFPKYMWDLLHPEFPEVHYFDNYGGAARTRTEFSTTRFYWSTPDATGKAQDYVPIPFAQAAYIINFAVLKGHSTGITVCGKNNYGSLLRCPDGYFRDANGKDQAGTRNYLNMHDSAPGFGTQSMGQYRAIVDLLGHRELGGKTVLFLIDGLFAGYYWDSHPYKWKTAPFGDGTTGQWPASLFASQDPVAIDSVAYDFLLNEWPAVVKSGGYSANFLKGSAEDYLHEAALADRPPSGTVYDPDKKGSPLASLGVHEHWNNAIDKQYSRNLGSNVGIELVALKVNREAPKLALRKAETQAAVSWSASYYGYQLQSATNLTPPVQWQMLPALPAFSQGQNVVSNSVSGARQFYRLIK